MHPALMRRAGTALSSGWAGSYVSGDTWGGAGRTFLSYGRVGRRDVWSASVNGMGFATYRGGVYG